MCREVRTVSHIEEDLVPLSVFWVSLYRPAVRCRTMLTHYYRKGEDMLRRDSTVCGVMGGID